MVAIVLTKSSWLRCEHQVTPGPGIGNNGLTSKLKVEGVEVMLAGDLDGVSISAGACPVVPDESKGIAMCTLTASRTAGDARKLKVAGVAVLTADTSGLTNGKPPPPPAGPKYSVLNARQTKLKAV